MFNFLYHSYDFEWYYLRKKYMYKIKIRIVSILVIKLKNKVYHEFMTKTCLNKWLDNWTELGLEMSFDSVGE